MEIVWFDTKSSAKTAEAQAIASELPRYNKKQEARRLLDPLVIGPGPQIFTAWIADTDNMYYEVARKLELSDSNFTELTSGRRVPDSELAGRIASLTDDAVPIGSWETRPGKKIVILSSKKRSPQNSG